MCWSHISDKTSFWLHGSYNLEAWNQLSVFVACPFCCHSGFQQQQGNQQRWVQLLPSLSFCSHCSGILELLGTAALFTVVPEGWLGPLLCRTGKEQRIGLRQNHKAADAGDLLNLENQKITGASYWERHWVATCSLIIYIVKSVCREEGWGHEFSS